MEFLLPKLKAIAENAESLYSHRALKKGDQVRHIWVPNPELMSLLRRIHRRILTPITLPSSVHGAVQGRSPRTNAEEHLASKCVVKVDVQKFFDKVRHEFVYRMFRHELGFGTGVSRLLTRLTTRGSSLPQGTPTSPAIANLLLIPIDGRLQGQSIVCGVKITRFVDDITVSGDDPRNLINVIARLLSSRRLPIHRAKKDRKVSKLQIIGRSSRQEVTGLVVNGSKPSIAKVRRDKVRAAIHQLTSAEDPSQARSIAGRIEHVRRYNPGSAKRLTRQLETIKSVSKAGDGSKAVPPIGPER